MFSFLPTNCGFAHKYHCNPRPHQRGLGIFAKCHSFAETKVPERGLFGQHWQSSLSSFIVTTNFRLIPGWIGRERTMLFIYKTDQKGQTVCSAFVISSAMKNLNFFLVLLVLFTTKQYVHGLKECCFRFVYLMLRAFICMRINRKRTQN